MVHIDNVLFYTHNGPSDMNDGKNAAHAAFQVENLFTHEKPLFRGCLYCWLNALRYGPFDGATRYGTGATGSGRNSKEESDEAEVMTIETVDERSEVFPMTRFHR